MVLLSMLPPCGLLLLEGTALIVFSRRAEIPDWTKNEYINKNRPWVIFARGKAAELHKAALWGL